MGAHSHFFWLLVNHDGQVDSGENRRLRVCAVPVFRVCSRSVWGQSIIQGSNDRWVLHHYSLWSLGMSKWSLMRTPTDDLHLSCENHAGEHFFKATSQHQNNSILTIDEDTESLGRIICVFQETGGTPHHCLYSGYTWFDPCQRTNFFKAISKSLESMPSMWGWHRKRRRMSPNAVPVRPQIPLEVSSTGGTLHKSTL